VKRCSKCGETKPVSEFHKKSSAKNGLSSQCKACTAVNSAKYRAANKEKIAAEKARYQRENKEEISKRKAKYYAENREAHAKRSAKYRDEHKEEIAIKKAKYYRDHREALAKYYASRREKRAAYRQENKEKFAEQWQEYYKNNREKIRENDKLYRESRRKELTEYKRIKRESDVQYRLACNLRARLYRAIKNNLKTGSAVRDLGCTIAELKERLEKQFQPGMSWDSYGPTGWHIDHRTPLASFDLTDREQLLEACRYTNLQPMWAAENLSKGARIPGESWQAD